MDKLGKEVPKPVVSFLERLKAETIFGAPQQQGDLTVIPVAELRARLGYGFGGGSGPVPKTNGKADGKAEGEAKGEGGDAEAVAEAAPGSAPLASGSGAGAGGTADLQPRGYIQLSPDGASWVPIEDSSRTDLAGIALVGWVVFWVGYTIRTVAKLRGPSGG